MTFGTLILRLFALLRAFFYLYITIESLLLSYMYWNAYKKYKTTPIIQAVQILLLSIGIFFFYMTIIAIISFIDRKNILYDLMITLIPVFVVPLILSVINFRNRSTEEVSKDGEHLVQSYKLKNGKRG